MTKDTTNGQCSFVRVRGDQHNVAMKPKEGSSFKLGKPTVGEFRGSSVVKLEMNNQQRCCLSGLLVFALSVHSSSPADQGRFLTDGDFSRTATLDCPYEDESSDVCLLPHNDCAWMEEDLVWCQRSLSFSRSLSELMRKLSITVASSLQNKIKWTLNLGQN